MPTGPPSKRLMIVVQDLAVDGVEAEGVDLQAAERYSAASRRDAAVAAHLGEVAHAAQQAVGDARRAARAAADLLGARVVDGDARAGAPSARTIAVSSSARVEVERLDDAEARQQRRREQAGARGRADQREALERQR